MKTVRRVNIYVTYETYIPYIPVTQLVTSKNIRFIESRNMFKSKIYEWKKMN